MGMQLNWVNGRGGVPLPLNRVNLKLSSVDIGGVYIIWHGGGNGRCVYVGQGEIADRLQRHRSNDEIQAYVPKGLFVTWAYVARPYRDGIECYLADTLKPLVGSAYPNVQHIRVNHRWD